MIFKSILPLFLYILFFQVQAGLLLQDIGSGEKSRLIVNSVLGLGETVRPSESSASDKVLKKSAAKQTRISGKGGPGTLPFIIDSQRYDSLIAFYADKGLLEGFHLAPFHPSPLQYCEAFLI